MGAFSHIPSLWLDVTRLVTRIGRNALTGIDRVELAYLREALASECEHFICRTTRGYLLLDQRGARLLVDLVDGAAPLGSADWISRLTFRGQRPRHRVEAALRRVAVDRCRPTALARMLRRYPTEGRVYLNVGHSNLSDATLTAFAEPSESGLVVLIHDLIPLTHPQFVVPDQPANFAARMERVRRYATHVIANSEATDGDLSAHWAGHEAPRRVIAPLGLDPRPPVDAVPRESRTFVMLGTIEARKNHALMLDVWDLFAADTAAQDMPQLHIIGATGWRVEELMARLHAHPLLGRSIFVHGALSDTEVQERLASATALLFPSLAEGFGYPPLEAAMAGAVPICSNLPVFRETLGDCAVYVDSADANLWKETIKQQFDGTGGKVDPSKLRVPTWQEHFETVANAITPRIVRERP